ncbi:MAG: purine-binding chemotaxis protein CheW [Chloroflexi bacterium]|nr:MAG: purine-binding chemotaxis protein CheW [Chloroflexota bacterium]
MSDQIEPNFAISEDGNIEQMYLTFGVQHEVYAVNIAHVTEIVSMQKISDIPDVPDYITGVINLRGTVIPLMDMRLRFNLPQKEYTDRTAIIVLDVEGVPTGLVVDEVHEVVEIPQTHIDPPPRWQSGGQQGVIRGLARQAEQVSIILDVARLLYDEHIQPEQVAEILAEAQAQANPGH